MDATCASCNSVSNARFITCPTIQNGLSPIDPFASPHPNDSNTSMRCPGSAKSRPSFSTKDDGLLYPLNAPSMNVDVSPVVASVRMNGGKTVGAEEVAMPASHCAHRSFWSRPLFGFL